MEGNELCIINETYTKDAFVWLKKTLDTAVFNAQAEDPT
jgi:hypothetical protein